MNSTHAAFCAVVLGSFGLVTAQEGAAPQAPASDDHVISIPGIRKLTIGGQARLRFENFLNYDLNRDQGDDNDFFGQRVRLNFDLEFDHGFSAYVQLQDVRNWGEETAPGRFGTIDGDANGFDLHQGWVQLEETPGIGGTSRVGRQEIAFGDHRLVGNLPWANQARSFDGVRQTWHDDEKTHRLQAFYFQLSDKLASAAGPTNVYSDAYFTGLYYTFLGYEDGETDLYALFLDDEETAAGGNENRLTLGTRWVQNYDNVELGIEAATQGGEVNGADVPFGETYAAHGHATLRLEDSSVWIRGEVNVASGNDPNSTDNERFNTLFPTGHAHLGIMDLTLWENIFHGMAQVGFDVCEKSNVVASWSFFRSMEETDAIRFGPRQLSMGGVGFSNTLGNELDVVYTKKFDTAPFRTSLQIGYGIFFPGAGAADANSGNDDLAHFAYVQGDLQF